MPVHGPLFRLFFMDCLCFGFVRRYCLSSLLFTFRKCATFYTCLFTWAKKLTEVRILSLIYFYYVRGGLESGLFNLYICGMLML